MEGRNSSEGNAIGSPSSHPANVVRQPPRPHQINCSQVLAYNQINCPGKST